MFGKTVAKITHGAEPWEREVTPKDISDYVDRIAATRGVNFSARDVYVQACAMQSEMLYSALRAYVTLAFDPTFIDTPEIMH